MPTMRALTAFTFRGRDLQPGDRLQAPPAEAAALKYQRKADFVTGEQPEPKKRIRKRRKDIQTEDLDQG